MRKQQIQSALIRAKVLQFIIAYKTSHDGQSPSMREIGDGCGISSTSMVKYYLDALVLQGKIIRKLQDDDTGKARNIHVPGGNWQFHETSVARKEPA